MSIQCGQSVTNAFEFAKALENLDGVRFQVLQMDRKHQPTTPKSLSDIHLISHISYIYDGNSCTGIKMLGQSFSNHQSIYQMEFPNPNMKFSSYGKILL